MKIKILSAIAVTTGLAMFVFAGFNPTHAAAKSPSLLATGATTISTSPYAGCVARYGTPDECAAAYGVK